MSLENTVMALARHVQMLEERLARTEKQAALMGVFGDRPSSTDSVVDVLRLERGSTGTAADGIGVGLPFFVQDASGNIEEVGNIDVVNTTAAHATQKSRMEFGVLGAIKAWLNSVGIFSVGDAYTEAGHMNVAKNDSYTRLVAAAASSGATLYYPVLDLRVSKGTLASPGAVTSASTIYGAIQFRGQDDAGTHAAAEIRGSADGTPGSGTDMPGKLGFYTCPDGSATLALRLTIQGDGTLTIADACNIAVNATTGTKIGTAASQKIGLWNATPVVQRSHIADATNATDVITRANAIILALEQVGILAAS
jgi:hypothetical protein